VRFLEQKADTLFRIVPMTLQTVLPNIFAKWTQLASPELPPKVRELVAQLERAGFRNKGGKGSHRNYVHPKLSRPITISGRMGDDAKRYQMRAVWQALAELER